MITQKKLVIPIFDFTIYVFIIDKWEELKGKFGNIEMSGLIEYDLTRGVASLVINTSNKKTIVHEANHIKNLIWRYIGYTPQPENDEVDSYLVAYIYNRIVDIYDKHNL
jgi:hypothetical protein